MKNQSALNSREGREHRNKQPSLESVMDGLLSDLNSTIPARFSVLVDKIGRLIASAGVEDNLDLVVLGALVSGDLAASQEIARVTGQYQDCQMILREGDQTHIFITDAGEQLILFVQVRSDVPLGWARMRIRDVARRLEETVATTDAVSVEQKHELDPKDFSDQFDRALEDLWSK